ncbi:MAG: pleD 2 [Planctomycetaceae bacterium]|nr:pleD 2 [Planctomycetaceae bacterium]
MIRRYITLFMISVSLVGVTLSLLCAAFSLGLIPDDYAMTLRSRGRLCESVAIGCSSLAKYEDSEALQAMLQATRDRNPDMKALGIRRANGQLICFIGNHAQEWEGASHDISTETHMRVPITFNKKRWGTVEIAFQPIRAAGWRGWLESPLLKLSVAYALLGTLAYCLYLSRVLTMLNPSRVVPQRVRAALDTLGEGLLLLDHNERIVMSNRAFREKLRFTEEQLIGQPVSRLPLMGNSAELKENSEWEPWSKVLRDSRPYHGTVVESVADYEHKQMFIVNSAPIMDDAGHCRGVVASFEDVTELEKNKRQLVDMLGDLNESLVMIRTQNQELERLATRDPLTGCLNRRSFFEIANKEWDKAVGLQQPLSCIMVDLDHFKAINDNHGHGAGDMVLKMAADALQQAVRDVDLVCRYGGEEFTALLPGADADQAAIVAERIRKTLSCLDIPKIPVTGSLGISSVAFAATTLQDMLEQADKALYGAKRSGRNRVMRWDLIPPELLHEKPAAKKPSRDNPIAESMPIPYPAVTALVSSLAYRDLSTAEHSWRVADLCVAVAQGLMSMSECYVLEVAALLHDIGKIGVPDHILLKPGPLTREEWQVMHRHDHIGVEIIRASFASDQLSEIIEMHHAFFGGTARDLALPEGQDIPLGARILTIADSFDAMVSDRVYRKGRSASEAFAELRSCANTQFDPELVERFIEVVSLTLKGQSLSATPVTNQVALSIGMQMERIAAAVDAKDFDRLGALAEHVKTMAARHGLDELASEASELEQSAQRGDVLSMIHATNRLMEHCRRTQASFCNRARAARQEPALAGTA